MRTAILGVVLAAVSVGAMAEAALPPRYQRERELAAVLEAAVRALDAPVDQVAWTGEDRYRAVAGRCSVEARIVSTPGAAPPGPRRFTVRLARPVCR